MINVAGFTKNLNRVSRQVKSLIQLIGLLVVLAGLVTVFYQSYREGKSLDEIVEAVMATPQPSPLPTPQVLLDNLEQATVSRVVDGDTIKLEDGRTLRYIGIDTPETVAPQKPIECFGKEASEFNRLLVEGKTVWLEKDISETDRYGRLLRYVYLNPEASLSAQVNYRLVAEGYAYASSYPPDVKWQSVFTEVQMQAQQHEVGLWNSCVSVPNREGLLEE